MAGNHCTITLHNDKWFELEGSYNEEFIDTLKKTVPFTERSWSSEDKIWGFHPRHTETILALAKEFYDRAWSVEGASTTDLHTGETITQSTIFEDWD